MNDVTIEQLDNIVKAAKVNVELHEAIERLKDNPDFQRIILKGFLTEHALNLVVEKAKHSNRGELDQQYINNQLMGVGVLSEYFSSIRVLANSANEAIASADAERTYYLNQLAEGSTDAR